MAGQVARASAGPHRLCLQGILSVLHTGIGWEGQPQRARVRLREHLLSSAGPLDRSRRVRRGEPESLVDSGD